MLEAQITEMQTHIYVDKAVNESPKKRKRSLGQLKEESSAWGGMEFMLAGTSQENDCSDFEVSIDCLGAPARQPVSALVTHVCMLSSEITFID